MKLKPTVSRRDAGTARAPFLRPFSCIVPAVCLAAVGALAQETSAYALPVATPPSVAVAPNAGGTDVSRLNVANAMSGVQGLAGDPASSRRSLGSAAVTSALQTSASLSSVVSIADFGAKCDGVTDDTAAINAALSSAGAGVGVLVPSADVGCMFKSTITVPSGVTLFGQGTGASHLINGSTNEAYMIQMNGNNGTIRDLDINAEYTGTNTSGTAIFMNITFQALIDHVNIEGPCIGIDLNGTSNLINFVQLNDVQGSNCGGITIGRLTTLSATTDPYVYNVTQGGVHTTPALFGMYVFDAGGLTASGDDFIFSTYGTVIQPGANQQVLWSFFDNTVLGDTNGTNALLVGPSSPTGVIRGLQCTSCWVASSGQDAILVNNPFSGTIAGLNFLGLRDFNAAGNGATFMAGSDVHFVASHICGYGTGKSGVLMQPGMSGWSVIGGEIGGTCEGYSTSPTFGVGVGGSNQNFAILDNTFSGVANAVGGVTTGLSSNQFKIENNLGLHTGTPTLSSCGGASLTPGSTDERGAVVVSSGSAVTCTLNFAAPWLVTPASVTTSGNTPAFVSSSSVGAVTLNISPTTGAATVYYSVRQ